MAGPMTVLLLGGTGRTGRRVLEQLLSRGVTIRAIVRPAARIPTGAAADPHVSLIEGVLLSLSDEALQRHLHGCDAVVSCLGHVLSVRGVFGPPRDLVARATSRICRAIEALRPEKPVKLILMTSVSVHRPAGLDTRRPAFERVLVWMLRGVLPPAKDNQRAADYLSRNIQASNPHVQWVVVRPDTLSEGDASDYLVHEGLVSSLFRPDQTSMANVAHFMSELVTNSKTWEEWKGLMPVIVNARPRAGPGGPRPSTSGG